MKEPSTPKNDLVSKTDANLLNRIRAVRSSVGDGLNDDEFTRLLRETALPTEAGFAFLSFSDSFVTLKVPLQDLSDWYPERGWITATKEQTARAIARKYGLSLWEPPDQSTSFLFPPADVPVFHHHLELNNEVETVVAAHPQYLKIRLFGSAPKANCLWSGQVPLQLGPELLHDLSALYQP
jgi:hypothetical protein